QLAQRMLKLRWLNAIVRARRLAARSITIPPRIRRQRKLPVINHFAFYNPCHIYLVPFICAVLTRTSSEPVRSSVPWREADGARASPVEPPCARLPPRS